MRGVTAEVASRAVEEEEASAVAAAGADFVAVGDALFEDPRGPNAAAAEAAARLALTEITT